MAMSYQHQGKRALDVAISSAALILLAPIMAIVVVAIVLESGWPALFTQDRVGVDDRVFTLLKFRSMVVGTPTMASVEAHTAKVTRVGRIIRRLNLDELPQLVNILRGEMSIVGPRPALPTQTDLRGLRREGGADKVRPGLTGLAQISSYDGMLAIDKSRYDILYAGNVSLLSDFRIILRTVSYLRKTPPLY